jgi:hypothetical protein
MPPAALHHGLPHPLQAHVGGLRGGAGVDRRRGVRGHVGWGCTSSIPFSSTHSLKAPGFNPKYLHVISWFQTLLSNSQLVSLHHGAVLSTRGRARAAGVPAPQLGARGGARDGGASGTRRRARGRGDRRHGDARRRDGAVGWGSARWNPVDP